MKVFAVAADLLREALSRRWILALAVGVTALLATLGLSLRLEVVDGALAATQLFGKTLHTSIRSADVALRPVFQVAAYAVFYGGLLVGMITTADFGPTLLSPGRIEHLLALPLRRWELLLGTLLGVLALATAGAVYGAGGFALILGAKTGVWTAGPLWAALLSAVCFTTVYAAMLATAVFVRSGAVSAVNGGVLLVGGILASYRVEIGAAIEPGVRRSAFAAITFGLPRLAALGNLAGSLAAGEPPPPGTASLVLGTLVFGAGAFAIGVWHLERRDF